MGNNSYKYLIVGAGLAGASAIEGIREIDRDGSLALIGQEKNLPYDRPPLTKKLWFGKMPLEKVFRHDQSFYTENKVDLKLATTVASIDPKQKTVADQSGNIIHYEKLLLATGGRPTHLPLPGGDIEGLFYYRTLDDYLRLRPQAAPGKTALVIGGGFIGSEIAAALALNQVKVVMLFPGEYLCQRIFPETLGKAMEAHYLAQGIQIIHEKPASIIRQGEKFKTRTEQAREIESDMVIVGIGIQPETDLAARAELTIANGIQVDAYLRTDAPDIYAAGDNANFPCAALGKMTRLEHWDNASSLGKHAGKNMAGAHQAFDYLPYFFSDLFEFGYEAVGEIDSKLEVVADWKEENRQGTIYYVRDGKIQGVMMCNIWEQVDAARRLIGQDEAAVKGLKVA